MIRPLTYRHVGGDILDRGQPIARTAAEQIERATNLIGFFAREALAAQAVPDPDDAAHCARLAIELQNAVTGACRWHRCTDPVLALTERSAA